METETLNDLDLADWIFEWDDWPEEFLEQIAARKLNGNPKEDLCVFRCPDGALYAVAEWSKQWIHTPVDWYWGCNEADNKNWGDIEKPENHIEDFCELLRYNLWREAENAEELPSYQKAHNRHWAESDRILQEFELKFQIRLPLAVFRFFQKPAYIAANYTKKPAEFAKLSLTGNLHVPRRFFTISYFPNGSMLGLLYDRSAKPAVAVHDISDYTLPVTRDFNKFFSNPEAYISESLDWCIPDKSDFSDLIMTGDSKENELEILKPLTITENEEFIRIENNYPETHSFSGKIRNLIKGFGKSSDPRAEIINRLVSSPMDLQAAQIWMLIAEELFEAGFFIDAFRALDNAAAVKTFAPFCGNPEKNRDYKHLFADKAYDRISMKQIVMLYEKFSDKEDPLTRCWLEEVFPGGAAKMKEDPFEEEFNPDSV